MSATKVSAAVLMVNVFVYGTLKRGQPNHHWLTSSQPEHGIARLVGRGRMTRPYPLVIGTRYNIPFLLDQPDTGRLVCGEVYSVDALKLAHLDVLEDYPLFYGRERLDVELMDAVAADEEPIDSSCDRSAFAANTTTCWVYMLQQFPDTMLAKPMLAEYADSTEQPYQSRSVRVGHIRALDDLAH